MTKQPYNLSLTAGGLLYRESCVATELYIQHSDWNVVKTLITDENDSTYPSMSETITMTAQPELKQVKPEYPHLQHPNNPILLKIRLRQLNLQHQFLL